MVESAVKLTVQLEMTLAFVPFNSVPPARTRGSWKIDAALVPSCNVPPVLTVFVPPSYVTSGATVPETTCSVCATGRLFPR